jgi:hypothetical protein
MSLRQPHLQTLPPACRTTGRRKGPHRRAPVRSPRQTLRRSSLRSQ